MGEYGVVDVDDSVTRQYAHFLGRSGGSGLYHAHGVAQDVELHAYAREMTFEGLGQFFGFFGSAVLGMRVKSVQHCAYCFRDKRVRSDGVHVIVLDDGLGVLQFLCRGEEACLAAGNERGRSNECRDGQSQKYLFHSVVLSCFVLFSVSYLMPLSVADVD